MSQRPRHRGSHDDVEDFNRFIYAEAGTPSFASPQLYRHQHGVCEVSASGWDKLESEPSPMDSLIENLATALARSTSLTSASSTIRTEFLERLPLGVPERPDQAEFRHRDHRFRRLRAPWLSD